MAERKTSKKHPKMKQFWRNVDYWAAQYGLTNQQIAKIMGCSKSTLQNRKNKVESTTGDEMERLAEYFKIPLEQMMLPLVGAEVTPFNPEGDDAA